MEHNTALILMYHRVAEVRTDPWSLCVAPARFAEHMEALRETARPLPLARLTEHIHGGSVPPRSVVVTFDDGYVDNLQQAVPCLERFDVPATVFIATGYTGVNREFWWDELERILLRTATLPETLCLTVRSKEHTWSLGAASIGLPGESPGWRAWEAGPTARHSLYHAIWLLLQPLAETERAGLMQQIREWAKDAPASRPRACRAMTQEELAALACSAPVEIGAHTVTHPVLSSLAPEAQSAEILESKRTLETWLGRTVSSFAYPYGDFGDATARIVRDAGFARACSTIPGAVNAATDCLVLPRVAVEDWDGEEFRRRLNSWFDGEFGPASAA